MKDKHELLKFTSIQKMIASMRAKRGGDPAKSTEEGFLTYINRYVDFFGKQKGIKNPTPDLIMEHRKKTLESKDEAERREHEEIVMAFMNMLRQEKVRGKPSSSGKVAFALTSIRALYRANWKPLKGIPTPSIIVETDYKVPTPQELADACAVADDRLRTYILVAKDCGMSPGDLLSLTGKERSSRWGTVKEQIKKGICPIHIRIIRAKVKTRIGFYDTFVGEDGFEALQQWLRYRRVFRTFFNIGIRQLQTDFKTFGLKKMGWHNFVPKSCRKYFDGQLTLDDMNEALIEYFMGHSLSRVKGAYIVEKLKAHPEELRQKYLEHYGALKLP